jgi:hypothetical protein
MDFLTPSSNYDRIRTSLKFLQGRTQQDEPTKWRCKICTKPFRGEEFVHKHIRTKHPDEVKTIEDDVCAFLYLDIRNFGCKKGRSTLTFHLSIQLRVDFVVQQLYFGPQPHQPFSTTTATATA